MTRQNPYFARRWVFPGLLIATLAVPGAAADESKDLDSSSPASESVRENRTVSNDSKRPIALPRFEVAELHRIENPQGGITAWDLSHDGKVAISAGRDATVLAWDLDTGRERHRISLPSSAKVTSLAISSKGERALLGMSNGELRLVELATDRVLAKLAAHETSVTQVALSEDMQWAATVSEEASELRVWNLEKKEERRTKALRSPVIDLGFVSENEITYTFDYRPHKVIYFIWNFQDDRTSFSLGIMGGQKSNALFLPKKRGVLMGTHDGWVKSWQVPYQNVRGRVPTGLESVEQIAISPDGKYLTSYAKQSVVIRGLQDSWGAGRYDLPHAQSAQVRLSRNGRLLLGVDDDGTIQVWRLPKPADFSLLQETFLARLHQWMGAEDYQKLEDTISMLREEHPYLPWGESYLEYFYQSLAGSTQDSKEEREGFESKLGDWLKQFPDSVAARTLQARWYLALAWEARGSGFAHTVTPEGWRQFNHWSQKAHDVLESARELPGKDPEFYYQSLIVAKALGWERDQVDRVFEKSIELDPRYLRTYRAMGEYLLPRWHGEPGDLKAFMERLEDLPVGDADHELYAAICRSLFCYHGSAFYDATGLSYAKVKQGSLAQLREFPGHRTVLNRLAYAACINHDYPTAQHCFDRLGDGFDPAVWKTESSYKSLRSRKPPARISPERKRWLGAHLFSVVSMQFASEGKTLVTSSNEVSRRSIRIGNPDDAADRGFLPHLAGSIYACRVSPDGRYLIAVGEAQGEWPGVTLWDFSSGTSRTLAGHGGAVREVAFSPDGEQFATACYDKFARIWNVEDPANPVTLAHADRVLSIAFSPDGKLLATGAAGEVGLWDAKTAKRRATFAIDKSRAYCVVFSPDSKTVAATNTTRGVDLWDVENHQLMTTLPLNKTEATGMSFSPDGKLLAAGRLDHKISVWELNNAMQEHILEGHWGAVNVVAFVPGSKELASGSRDGSVAFWDVSEFAP